MTFKSQKKKKKKKENEHHKSCLPCQNGRKSTMCIKTSEDSGPSCPKHSKSYSHFFSKTFQHICVSLNVNFNELLTNVIVSFEQLGPDRGSITPDKAHFQPNCVDFFFFLFLHENLCCG